MNILISGYYGFDNFGDDLVLKVLVDELKLKKIENITVLSKNPKSTKEIYKVNSVQSFNIFAVICSVLKCDILISGGGSLLQDRTSIKSLFYYLFIIFTAQLFRKDVIIFAQGFSEFKNFISRILTINLLKKCKIISVRDEKSLFYLRSQNLKPVLVSDPVWNIPYQNLSKKIPNTLGIQLRNWTGLNDTVLDNLASCVQNYFSGYNVIIFPLQKGFDNDICEKFKKKLDKINRNLNVKIVYPNNFNEGIKIISQMENLIAMRYHACLIGLKNNVKVLPLIYDDKVENLSDECNLKYRINLKNTIDMALTIKNFANSSLSHNFSGKNTSLNEILNF